MKESHKNLLIAVSAVTAVSAIAAVSHSMTKNLVKVALDRTAPKVMNPSKKKTRRSLSGGSELTELRAKVKEAAENLESKNLETVEMFSSYDGERLVGHIWPCENAKRIVIAMHGWRSSWSKDFGIIADFWHDNGSTILFAEQRGQGNSGGNYMGFGLLERYDCLDWVHWVNDNGYNEIPIYLGGVSMGASTVLMTAGLTLPENVHGIIADCGFTSPHAIWKHVATDNLHMRYGLRGDIANEMCKKKINIGTKEYSCVDAMKNATVPVLFIHGTDDHFVPIEMTYENYKACAAPKRLLVVPGAEHGLSYLIDKEGYENALKNFWNDFDATKTE